MRYKSFIFCFAFLHLIIVDTLAQISDSELTTALSDENFTQALQLANKCIELDTNNIKCLEQGAMAAYKLGKFNDSKLKLNVIEKKEPSNKYALKQLATIYEIEENIPKAVKYYNRLVELDSLNSIYYRKLGQLYQKSEFDIEAVQYYSKAYAINQDDYYTIKGLSELLIHSKSFEEADSILLSALEKDSVHVQFNLMLARSKYIQKDFEATVERMESLRGKIDFNNYYNKMLGFAYIQVDSIDRAIFHLTKSLVGEGNPEHALYYLATAHEKKGENDLALDYFEKALKAGTSDQVDLYHKNLARLYKSQNQMSAAIKHYQKALEYSNDPLLLFLLGQSCDEYYKDKNIAVRYYKKYEQSDHPNQEYKRYAKERRLYLKEQIHLSK